MASSGIKREKDPEVLLALVGHRITGIEVSDLLPHTAECVDDIAVIRSC